MIVVYPPQTPVVVDRAQPVMHNYDQYGQEIQPQANNGGTQGATTVPPVSYLLAFRDGVIRQVSSYWVTSTTLHYVTMQHETKEVPTDTLDRNETVELNRERHVPFVWPSQSATQPR